jgi:NADPH-dependent 2,4-dienoyl-CoA reductase/sulfur reductase-like enzyme
MKLLIVGGVAGGASAAARARRLSEDSEIVLFERGPDVSFANCGLPYYVGGEIADRKKLLVTTPEMLRTRFKLDVRTRSSVEAIDRSAKKIRVRDLASGREYDESYDKLILAPGAAPLRPPIPGIDLPGVFTLRNLQDVEMTTPILETLVAKGVTVLLGQSAEGFENKSDGIAVRLKSGEQLVGQLVILGIGVRPENKLAVEAGLKIGPRGGIRVNEFLQTSDPNIYAVGDAIEVKDFVSGDPTQVPLAGPANRQGRIAADNVFGQSMKYRGTQGTAIVGVFDRTAAMTGASEKVLRRDNRHFRKVYVHPAHHAGYYPGAEQMTLKVLFHPETGKLLGAQAVGGAGVDKRIDVLALLKLGLHGKSMKRFRKNWNASASRRCPSGRRVATPRRSIWPKTCGTF